MTTPEEARERCRATVYYDGACPLCSIEIDHYRKQAGADALQFVDVSGDATIHGGDLSKADALKRFHIRQADGTLVSGAAAFVEVWRALPGWSWAARVASVPGVLPVLELMYRAFLPVRPALARAVGFLGLGRKHPAP